MNDKEVLIEARKLIAKPENWLKGHSALGPEGGVHPADTTACRWCATGALRKIVSTTPGLTVEDRLRICRRLETVVGGSVEKFNDYPGTTHAEVLYVFDKAIEACL